MSPNRKNAHPADKVIGRAVLFFREAKGMSHQDLSDRLGLDIDALVKVESGKRPLLAREFLWILEILDAPLSEYRIRFTDEDPAG